MQDQFRRGFPFSGTRLEFHNRLQPIFHFISRFSRVMNLIFNSLQGNCREFGNYCPTPSSLNAQVFSVVSNRDVREYCSLRRYCTSVQLKAHTVTLMWLVYYGSRKSADNVVNLRIGPYFPCTKKMELMQAPQG